MNSFVSLMDYNQNHCIVHILLDFISKVNFLFEHKLYVFHHNLDYVTKFEEILGFLKSFFVIKKYKFMIISICNEKILRTY